MSRLQAHAPAGPDTSRLYRGRMAEAGWSSFSSLDPSRPGVVAAVLSDGRVVDWRSFGSVAPGGEELGRESPLYVASLAKQLTAACIGSLVLDGRLDMTDPVGRWLPELADRLRRVRIEHLVSHTGGLASSNELDHRTGFAAGRPTTTGQRASALRGVELEHEPGTVHRYSNHGYVLLAEVVERVTGRPLGAFAADRIFQPLGMTSTCFLDVTTPEVVPGWADGVRRVDIRSSCTGDGGLVSTIADLSRWDTWLPATAVGDLMLRSRPILPDGTVAHDAWGISVRTHHGQRIESHGGAIEGYLAKYVRFPWLRTSFMALANTDELGAPGLDARVRRLADTVLGEHLDHRRPPWQDTFGGPVPPQRWHDGSEQRA